MPIILGFLVQILLSFFEIWEVFHQLVNFNLSFYFLKVHIVYLALNYKEPLVVLKIEVIVNLISVHL